MTPNPLLGVFYHWLGGLSSASFYVPYRGVRKWSWEIYWLTGGLFSWLIAPWAIAAVQTEDLLGVLGATPTPTLIWPFFFGMLWGFGGLTYGLTMRYLGLSLGMAVVSASAPSSAPSFRPSSSATSRPSCSTRPAATSSFWAWS